MTKVSNKLLNNNPINSAKYLQLNTLHKDEIDELNRKLTEMQIDYNSLLCDYKEKDTKINELERELIHKNKQIDDLNQQISSTISHFSADLLKNNSRVYKSVLGINARLESEIIKLKAEICEFKSQLEQSDSQLTIN